jgi:hypothetical protein
MKVVKFLFKKEIGFITNQVDIKRLFTLSLLAIYDHKKINNNSQAFDNHPAYD